VDPALDCAKGKRFFIIDFPDASQVVEVPTDRGWLPFPIPGVSSQDWIRRAAGLEKQRGAPGGASGIPERTHCQTPRNCGDLRSLGRRLWERT
jgi:hypothetical protein